VAELTKDLIIVRAGAGSLHNTWLDRSTPRTWDLLICPYENIPPPPKGSGILVSEVITPLKWASIKILLEKWQGWREYRYVIVADDDLFAAQHTWSRFFELCAHYGAKLAQPALADGSHYGHVLTMRNTQFVARRVSFVEIMMPCFRVDVLAQFMGTLSLSESGWGFGLDFLWAKQLEYRDLFVIDETPVLHTRQIHTNRKPEDRQMVEAELARILHSHQVAWIIKTLSGILPSGEEIPENNGRFLYTLVRGYDRLFEQEPKRFEQMIRLQLTAGNAYAAYLK
jgi:hypothetical protein